MERVVYTHQWKVWLQLSAYLRAAHMLLVVYTHQWMIHPCMHADSIARTIACLLRTAYALNCSHTLHGRRTLIYQQNDVIWCNYIDFCVSWEHSTHPLRFCNITMSCFCMLWAFFTVRVWWAGTHKAVFIWAPGHLCFLFTQKSFHVEHLSVSVSDLSYPCRYALNW
jgi:hypothetical protein